MTNTTSTPHRLLISVLIIVLILTAVIILDGPPTLTNKVMAEGNPAVLARYGYGYGAYCYPGPYCMFIPMILRKLAP